VIEWAELAEEFGFDLQLLPEASELMNDDDPASISSIYIDSTDAASRELLASQELRRLAPQARLIVSHPMSQQMNTTDLTEAGVFDALAQPLDPTEIRQSLAFLAAALERETASESGETGRGEPAGQNKNAEKPITGSSAA
jgi:DNA-binding NtrC family response regulator